jgi:hypothetical protein
VVADDPHPNPYPAKPVTPVPPFAVVSSFRDAEFAKGATTALRLAGLLFSAQEKVTLREETQDGVTIISYRYPDQSPAPNGDPENFRFNFLPSFAIVDRSLVLASRPSLIKALIPELRKDHAPGDWSPAVWRSRTYAPGLAALIRANPDPLVANAVLTEGVGWEAARRQLETLADWVSSLGTVDVTVEHKSDVFEATLSWATK